MNTAFMKFMAMIFFAACTFSSSAQNSATDGVSPHVQPVRHQRPADSYPRIPVSDFTHLWKRSQNCPGKDCMEEVLTLTAKDSSTVNISGIHGSQTKVKGKIKGYSISINLQKWIGGKIEGRLVISNDRKTLISYLKFYTHGKIETSSATFHL